MSKIKTKKLKLLLLDANVVIELFRLGVWDVVVENCDIILSRTVAEVEAVFYLDDNGFKITIDLSNYIVKGLITIIDVDVNALKNFYNIFDPTYFDRLDPGETESLAYLISSQDNCLISSGDSIVYKAIGCLHRSHQGISLEEILKKIGHEKKLDFQYTKRFRQIYTKKGQEDGITGIGAKKSK